jgi:hypothetical protein
MAWNAIDMILIGQFETDFGIQITDQIHPPDEASQEAVTAAASG